MDLKEPFVIEFKGPNGTARFSLPYPDEAFWLERARLQRVEKTSKGGEIRYKVNPSRDLDFKEVSKLATEKPDEFDEYDAEAIMLRLANAELIGNEQVTPATHRFDLRVFGGETVSVTLGYPSRRQVVKYHEGTRDQYSTRGGATTILSLKPTVELFTAVLQETAGYQNGVPVPHMDICITELLAIVDPND